ncbi:hypothetical protein OSB04_un001588 [Centaurea solstitialis]|uniref:Uncharacterized protein n=1 Tax=Centaurea solstitialis TaxID=347529 RepID=A0AA38SFC2_9ASTR|nr:hypothetical protein OSB04_un001588 [Centaurea solstitialis]
MTSRTSSSATLFDFIPVPLSPAFRHSHSLRLSHAPPVSAFPKAPLFFKRIREHVKPWLRFFAWHRIKPLLPRFVRAPVNSLEFHFCETYSPGGILNAFATALNGSIPHSAYVSGRPQQCAFAVWCSFRFSTHFTLHRKIPSAPTVLSLLVSTACPELSPEDLTADLKSTYRTLYGPTHSGNLRLHLCITAAVGTELAMLIPQLSPPLRKIPHCCNPVGSGPCSVPVWPDHPLGQLLIIALAVSAVVHLPGRFLRVTHPSATGNTNFPSDLHVLACRQRSPEPGSNSP